MRMSFWSFTLAAGLALRRKLALKWPVRVKSLSSL